MKTDGAFYYVPAAFYERSLLSLLEKIIAADQRAVLRVHDDARKQEVDDALWKIKQESFLPHGSDGDEMLTPAHKCPIWITAQSHNPNHSTILILLDGQKDDASDNFARVIALIRDDDAHALQEASHLWQEWQSRDWQVQGFHQSKAQASWQKLNNPLAMETPS